jgi:3-hydroxyacyl-[acyl-carrier-protein] dehydratase
LIAKSHPVLPGQVPVVTRQSNTRFRRLVRPGETLEIEVSITEQLANAFFLTGKVLVGGQTSVRLDFACTTTTPE